MKYLTVGEVIDRAASFVGMSPDNDQAKLFQYVDIAQKGAWKSGIYKGFLRATTVRVFENNGHRFIKTPHGYNVCMGINVNGKPLQLRDSYFQFHHNGPGSLTSSDLLRYADFGLAYSEYPTLLGSSMTAYTGSFKIGVLPLSKEDSEATIQIDAKDSDGNPIHFKQEGVVGSGFKLSLAKKGELLVGNVFKLSEVTGIHKSPTNGAVEVYALYETSNTPVLLARLEPFETASCYHLYELPKGCCQGDCIDALFKISEPEPISSREQRLIIDDMESILSLIIAADQTFDKKKLQEGEAFKAKGILGLDSESEAGKPVALRPIQVLSTDGPDNDPLSICGGEIYL